MSVVEKFASRKFILAVSAAVACFVNRQYTEAAGVVVAYLAAEGFVDIAAVRATKDAVNEEVDAVLTAAE